MKGRYRPGGQYRKGRSRDARKIRYGSRNRRIPVCQISTFLFVKNPGIFYPEGTHYNPITCGASTGKTQYLVYFV
jgi:hypothetical protein